MAFSGSSVKQGERHAVVYATGVNTFFGRAAALISGTENTPNLQKIMTRIGGICLFTIGAWVLIELVVQFAHYHHECTSGEGACSVCVRVCVCVCVLCGGVGGGGLKGL